MPHSPDQTPQQGGAYIVDPETGELVREGGTEPQTGCTPNPAFEPTAED